MQLLKGKTSRTMAILLKEYLDADMGWQTTSQTALALQAHMADLTAAEEVKAGAGGDIPRLKSRNSTKELN